MSYDRAAAAEYAQTGAHYPAADVGATAVYAVTPPSVQRPKRTISTRVAAIIAAVAFVVGAAVAILVGMIVGPGGAGGTRRPSRRLEQPERRNWDRHRGERFRNHLGGERLIPGGAARRQS